MGKSAKRKVVKQHPLERAVAAGLGAMFQSVVDDLVDGTRDMRVNVRRALDAVDDYEGNPRARKKFKKRRVEPRPASAPDDDVIDMERGPDGAYREKK